MTYSFFRETSNLCETRQECTGAPWRKVMSQTAFLGYYSIIRPRTWVMCEFLSSDERCDGPKDTMGNWQEKRSLKLLVHWEGGCRGTEHVHGRYETMEQGKIKEDGGQLIWWTFFPGQPRRGPPKIVFFNFRVNKEYTTSIQTVIFSKNTCWLSSPAVLGTIVVHEPSDVTKFPSMK